MKKKIILTVIIFMLISIKIIFYPQNIQEKPKRININEIKDILKTTTLIKLCKFSNSEETCNEDKIMKEIKGEELQKYLDILLDTDLWEGTVTLVGRTHKMDFYNSKYINIAQLQITSNFDLTLIINKERYSIYTSKNNTNQLKRMILEE